MSGHSKWKTIKHKKALTDSKKSKGFTKVIKEITIAARQGGGDITGNPRLRTLVEKAREINMPLDNVTRAIKKGTGELPGVSYEAGAYEGYGPGGIAILIETLTDNKNKAIAEIRHVFSRHSCNLTETGAINWMFERLGVIRAQDVKLSEDELLEHLLDYDVKDVGKDDGDLEITCNPKALESVKKALQNLGIKVDEAEVEMVAKTPVDLDEKVEERALEFLDAIEELEDVQNVYTNLG